jgi:hypothetical protein
VQPLADSNAKQKESLEVARRYNREHKDDIAAKTKQTKKSWMTWREATDYYLENGGAEKVATVAERQQKLDPEKRKVLETLFYGKFQGAIGGKALLANSGPSDDLDGVVLAPSLHLDRQKFLLANS